MNERKPNSLEELKQAQTKLQNALVKAEVVHATVGGPAFSRHLQTGGKTDREREEAVERVTKIRNKLKQNAIPHLTAHIDLTQELIKDLELERPRLITLYEDYLSEKRRIEELEATFKSHISIGRLQPSALERIEKLEKEHTLRGSEPELLKAKSVWEESKAEEEKKEEIAVAAPKIEEPTEPSKEAENQLPKLKVDRVKKEVQLEEWVLPKKINSNIDWAVFHCLAESLLRGEPLAQHDQLKKAAWEAGSKDKNVAGQSVFRLRRILEPDPDNPQLIVRTSSIVRNEGKTSFRTWEIVGYRLNAQVQFVGGPQKEEPVPTAPKKEEKAVTLEEIDNKIAIIKKAVATGAMPQSELAEALRIRATLVDGAKNPDVETLPKMKIDESTRKVAIDGRVVQFREGLTFDSLVHIAKLSNKQIPSAELKKFLGENGSKDDSGNVIYHIRETLEIDAKYPQILKSFKLKGSSDMIYGLFADIEFGIPLEELKFTPRTYIDSREMPLPDGQIVSASGFRCKTLEFFLDSPDLTSPSDDAALAIYGGTDRKSRKKLSGSIYDLNISLLEQRGWQFVNLTSPEATKRGQKAQYRLEKIPADITQTKEDQPKEPAKRKETAKVPRLEPKEIPLPDGRVVKTSGQERQALELFLIEGIDKSLMLDDVSLRIFGNADQKARQKTRAIIFKLNTRKLKKLGWHIENITSPEVYRRHKKSQYRLEKIVPDKVRVKEEESPTLAPTEEASIDIAAGPTESTIQAPNVPEGFIEVPFTLTEEERRSPEETKILQVITALINRNSSQLRINFHEVISGLKSEIQMKIKPAPVGKRNIPIYSAEELKQKYSSALRKFREEQAIRAIKETWSDDEKKLWREITTAVNRFSWGDFEDFSRKVKTEIDRSQRQFYRDYPTSHGGNRVDWIQG